MAEVDRIDGGDSAGINSIVTFLRECEGGRAGAGGSSGVVVHIEPDRCDIGGLRVGRRGRSDIY